jgi:hypothetical protein
MEERELVGDEYGEFEKNILWIGKSGESGESGISFFLFVSEMCSDLRLLII